MFSRFFIERPIFSSVMSIVIVIAGGLCIPILPIEQTPDITPPTVMVTTNYPGSSAAVLADSVAFPIEEQVNGVEGMLYMQSKCSDDGSYELTVTFEVGTDIDMATVLVQNRVAVAQPKLPEEVKREGVKTEKRSTAMILMVNVYSEQQRYDELYISNYISLNIKDELARAPGVGKVNVMGAKDYGMRIWLDPQKLKARGLTTNEVVDTIREQNVQVAAGRIGASPSPAGQDFEYTVSALGRLTDVEQFKNMILKVGDNGSVLRVKDVARVELGAQSYNWEVTLNGEPSIGVAMYQLPGANSLDAAKAIRATMDRLAEDFPPGLKYKIAYDTTKFVTASIEEVVETLVIAVILVILTVYVFLQDFRTTLIPALTIPVSLIGTFAVMLVLGLSINTLTLFGLVLAIGIVVDDAIVVVENTMRLIDEEGLSSRAAALQAMEEVAGPVVATTLVLLAVFVPTTVMPGITGRLYAQFSMTIATSTVISSLNALTLAPALCGILLRPSPKERRGFFKWFNDVFQRTTTGYMGWVTFFIRRTALSILIFAVFAGLTVLGFIKVPGGFLPDEDQGYFMISAQLPEGATLERTREVMSGIEGILEETPGIADTISVVGYSALDALATPNAGTYFVVLKNWSDRTAAEERLGAILRGIQPKLTQIEAATCFAFIPPPITGLGNAGGFEFQLLDQGNAGYAQLETAAQDMVAEAMAAGRLTRMNNNFRASVPQLFVDVDRTKAKKMHVPLASIFSTLQANLGSVYVNDFNKFGRTYKVMIQADQQFRSQASDIGKLEVRNASGGMVPLSTLVTVNDTVGPKTIYRFQQYPSATITGQGAAGVSSGQAIVAMQDLAGQVLPPSMGYQWSGVTSQQLAAGNLAPIIFSLAIVFVYLFLAAQYESWSIPLAVLLSVPLAILGAMTATAVRGLDNNIYTQIGLVLLIGLSAKSAILIVEFAKQRREEGLSIEEAASGAARLRFRAILMTAFSFILGVIPLVIATGAGAGSRRALGTAVFGGMTAATVLGVFMIPFLYVFVQRTSEAMRSMAEPVEGEEDSKEQAE
jgi:HAE1 family hydrophobic/amphiphilic exporter-1